ncbi:MAG: hypothetical protein ACLQU2_16670 [Candidatus Binataceae bacterium]
MAEGKFQQPRRIGCCATSSAILLGWYLMLPPIDVANWRVDRNAPLSQWQRAGDYRSFAESMTVRAQILTPEIPPALDQTTQSTFQYTKLDSQCVPGDDPRLAPPPKL